MNKRLFIRWWGPLAAALVSVVGLLVGLKLFYVLHGHGNEGMVGKALHNPVMSRFAQGWVIQEILPLYVVTAYLGWCICALVGRWLLGKNWSEAWTGWAAFKGGLGGLVLIHAWLWWMVPGALAVIPVLSRLPFWLGLPIPFMVGLGLLRWALPEGKRAHVVAASSLVCWSALAQLPLQLRELPEAQPTGGKPVSLLLLAQDGLRLDTAYEAGLATFEGQHAEAAVSPVCGTRMLYSLLWGGDPLRFTSSHIVPDIEEYRGDAPFHTIQELAGKGKKVRYYIDDGGTIGLLANRRDGFDRVVMPANGWENFINSNISSHFPLFASWLDVLRIFPSTHPWASMDLALRRVLDDGRGADVVMFHSCLAHTPIFLTRRELGHISGWWTLTPAKFEPMAAFSNALQGKEELDPRHNPYLAYRLRMSSVIQAWAPLWNKLKDDPDYRDTTRLFFSDHGERFYHVTEHTQIAGLHGYDIDPWQSQVPLVLNGPGVQLGTKVKGPVSLLGVRRALHDYATSGSRPTFTAMQQVPVVARWNPMELPIQVGESEFFSVDPTEIQDRSWIGAGGMWAMTYKGTLEDRGKMATVARMENNLFTVYRPLKKGGAMKTRYDGYRWLDDTPVDEAAYRKAKAEVEAALVDQTIR